ncbi:MAG: hypothetical protein IPP46_05850 [Bacteroidetes bacterium]|nr:hypothetical protein [Bacteroidota bacterium]
MNDAEPVVTGRIQMVTGRSVVVTGCDQNNDRSRPKTMTGRDQNNHRSRVHQIIPSSN